MAMATPVYAGTPKLAGAPSHAQNYKMQNGVKVYRTMSAPQNSVEHGVKIHRLMPTPSYYSNQTGHNVRSTFDNQINMVRKRAKKEQKKAFKKGYKEGYQDGYQTAVENQRTRRPIRLRQRTRTRPRVPSNILRRRNLQ